MLPPGVKKHYLLLGNSNKVDIILKAGAFSRGEYTAVVYINTVAPPAFSICNAQLFSALKQKRMLLIQREDICVMWHLHIEILCVCMCVCVNTLGPIEF